MDNKERTLEAIFSAAPVVPVLAIDNLIAVPLAARWLPAG